MTEQQQAMPPRGRVGGRWINERPTPEEFAEWFKGSMKIDPALKVEDYIGGVVLIPAVDNKSKYVRGYRDDKPIIDERPELSYVPYPKVETRIAYFWDLLEAHEDWVGVVEHVESPRLTIDPFVEMVEILIEAETGERRESTKYRQPGGLATMVHQLPTGYSVTTVPVGDSYSHFLCCTIRVAIYKADANGEPTGRPLRTGRGTKQVPLVRKGWQNSIVADENSLMKCETGALGRALGFAGIFSIPGSGVATAEDMLESMAQGETPAQAAAPPEPTTPDVRPARTGAEQAVEDEETLKVRAMALFKTLRDDHPGRVEDFTTWAHARKLKNLGEAKGPVLIGVIRKLEKLIDESEAAPVEESPLSADDVVKETDGVSAPPAE